jgi:putative ABC transport system permease protein
MNAFSKVTGRPPFSTSVYIFPSSKQPMPIEAVEKLTQHIGQTVATEVGLPLRHLGVEVSSGGLLLQPAPDSPLFGQGNKMLGSFETTYIADVTDQMKIIEGAALDENGSSKGTVDVWMYESTAQSMGIHLGEKLELGATLSGAKTPIRVAGIWQAKDPKGEFWFSGPDMAYQNALLVRRKDYIQYFQPMDPAGSGQVSWYVILDQNKIRPKESQHYLDGFQRAQVLINKYLPGVKMNMAPIDPLTKFVATSATLTVLLLGYNLPAYAILLYFLVLTAAIMSQWQRRETVMLVSRGLSLTGILNLTLVEQLILFIIGYPLGIAFGMLVARLMGYTSSFLSFTSRAALPVSLEGLSLPLTILALAFVLISRLWPTLRMARSSLVTEEHERARPMNKPFWYRFYLDIILLLPTYYAFDQMSKRGSLAGLITTANHPEDLFRDPLLIIVPALFILTVSLVTIRIFALCMRLIDLVAGYAPWLSLHLALRQLGRQSLDYISPLLLVVIALAMGVYTLSMAASLDQWTIDRMYYSTGADLVFKPGSGPTGETSDDGSWIPLPQDFQSLPGVQAATNVGDFGMQINPFSEQEIRGRFLAIDRLDFPAVAWFRSDFASESLGGLMNRLAANPQGILVSQKFLTDNRLRIGDTVPVTVSLPQLSDTSTDFTIVGSYQYFPTVYDDTVTIIGNLDYLNTMTGLIAPHDLWLKLKPGTNVETLSNAIEHNLAVKPTNMRDTQALIADEQGRMERVGIFGTLSVGFLASAIMAILGLLIYSYASLQERAYRLAVLNAIGLSRGQILTQVIFEYAFLALFGALAGALIGTAASHLFVPFFRYTGGTGVPLPPLIPILSGSQLRNLCLIFGVTIVGIEVITTASVLRNRLVQILKRVWM